MQHILCISDLRLPLHALPPVSTALSSGVSKTACEDLPAWPTKSESRCDGSDVRYVSTDPDGRAQSREMDTEKMGQQVVERDGGDWMKGGLRPDGLLLLRTGAILGIAVGIRSRTIRFVRAIA